MAVIKDLNQDNLQKEEFMWVTAPEARVHMVGTVWEQAQAWQQQTVTEEQSPYGEDNMTADAGMAAVAEELTPQQQARSRQLTRNGTSL